MDGGISTKKQQEIGRLGFAGVPAIISAAGDRASFRFVEFFTANIRNQNTRVSYGRALRDFCNWCEERGLRLEHLNPVIVAGYVEQLGRPSDKDGGGYSKPSIKQHLAAIRMLFDYLVTGGILRTNPASSVRGPKYSIKRGKTPFSGAVLQYTASEWILSQSGPRLEYCRVYDRTFPRDGKDPAAPEAFLDAGARLLLTGPNVPPGAALGAAALLAVLFTTSRPRGSRLRTARTLLLETAAARSVPSTCPRISSPTSLSRIGTWSRQLTAADRSRSTGPAAGLTRW